MTFDAELPEDHRAAVFALDSGRALLEEVCRALGVEPGAHEERDFVDGEHKIRPLQAVRGRDVFVVQSFYSEADLSVNDKLMRVFFFLAALRDAGADRLTLLAPYLSYARKDRRTKPWDPVSLRYLAQHLETAGLDRMGAVDVHNPSAYENAFRVPAIALTAAPLFVDALAPRIGQREAVVVSPDAGGVKRAERFRQDLERWLGRSVALAFVEKFRSGGVVWGGTVVGAIEGRVAVILDDLISSGTTLAGAAAACRERGACAVYAAATHGVFSDTTGDTLSEGALDRVVVTDTVRPALQDEEARDEELLGGERIACASFLAATIHRLHTNGSIIEFTSVQAPP
jgi:ribose-phosphate pyrophosphokinase